MTTFTCEDSPQNPLEESAPSESEEEMESEDMHEFALTPGERYGWWADHQSEDRHSVALVHGAMNNRRVKIMLDSGESTSILSLNLARRLKLKLKTNAQLRVTGLGGVPTYITAQACVKITLGHRVAYVLNMWVGNIGDGVECLLGMDFMMAAGVRLCVRERMVRLPDEETILLVDGPEENHLGVEVGVTVQETTRLLPGRAMVVPVRYGRADSETAVMWAGRGDQWVTQVIYNSQRRPSAVRVINISDHEARVLQHTVVACLVEPDHLPHGDIFVRPGARKYCEWRQLAYESEPSAEFRRREKYAAWREEQEAPPAVLKPTYPWPTKILLRPKPNVSDSGPRPPRAEKADRIQCVMTSSNYHGDGNELTKKKEITASYGAFGPQNKRIIDVLNFHGVHWVAFSLDRETQVCRMLDPLQSSVTYEAIQTSIRYTFEPILNMTDEITHEEVD